MTEYDKRNAEIANLNATTGALNAETAKIMTETRYCSLAIAAGLLGFGAALGTMLA